jgi:HD-like signal output (HDOD) protein
MSLLAFQSPPNRHPELSELFEGVTKVSGHREVLVRLNGMLEDESCGSTDLVEVLQMDPGLAARVITAANTVHFRGGNPVASVLEAVVRVGVQEIRRLLLSSMVRELAAGALRSYGLAPGALWRRSVMGAISMEVLAKAVSRSTDVCYTAGLMHNVGMVIVDGWLGKRSDGRPARIGDIDALDITLREKEAIGWTSAEVGAELLQRWRFPESVAAAVRHQNNPLDAGQFSAFASLLKLALWQMRTIEAQTNGRDAPRIPGDEVCKAARLEPDALRELLGEVKQRIADARMAAGVL